jgi:hypothetical protein
MIPTWARWLISALPAALLAGAVLLFNPQVFPWLLPLALLVPLTFLSAVRSEFQTSRAFSKAATACMIAFPVSLVLVPLDDLWLPVWLCLWAIASALLLWSGLTKSVTAPAKRIIRLLAGASIGFLGYAQLDFVFWSVTAPTVVALVGTPVVAMLAGIHSLWWNSSGSRPKNPTEA